MGRRHHFFVLCFLSAGGCAAPPARPPLPAPGRAAEAPAKPALPAAAMSPQDINAITAQHNKARADVGVGPLQWSPDIAAFAQQWAEQLALSGCQMKHRNPNAYGEKPLSRHLRCIHRGRCGQGLGEREEGLWRRCADRVQLGARGPLHANGVAPDGAAGLWPGDLQEHVDRGLQLRSAGQCSGSQAVLSVQRRCSTPPHA